MKQNANWAWTGGVSRDATDDAMDYVRFGGPAYDIPRTRPPKPVPIDLEALAEWNEGIARSREAYFTEQHGGRS